MKQRRRRVSRIKVGLAAAGLMGALALTLCSETVTFTTSYPSPAGIYRNLTTTLQTVLAREQGGRVGIGTTAPGAKLHVQGSALVAGGLNVAGRIGVGTSSPATTLDVDGSIAVRGGSPGAGKVLTSDAAGMASWQPASGGGHCRICVEVVNWSDSQCSPSGLYCGPQSAMGAWAQSPWVMDDTDGRDGGCNYRWWVRCS